MLLENPEKFGDFFKLTWIRFYMLDSIPSRQTTPDDGYYFWSKEINRRFWLLILFFGTFCVKFVMAGRRADESENILLLDVIVIDKEQRTIMIWSGQFHIAMCIVDVSMWSYSVFYNISRFIHSWRNLLSQYLVTLLYLTTWFSNGCLILMRNYLKMTWGAL